MREKDIVADAWDKHSNLVRWTVWRIIRRYGGDFDELFSEALVQFTIAVKRHDPNKSSLSHYISFRVYKQLLEIKRNEARRLNITGPVQVLKDVHTIYNTSFSDLWKDLSGDSQQVLLHIFGLTTNYKNKSLAKLAVRQELKEQNWTNDRINDCFREIEAALT